MKKRFIILGMAALLLVGVVAPNAFAHGIAYTAGGPKAAENNWFDQMFEWHNSWVDKAVKDGQMDPKQAEEWKKHFNYMRDFHEQNGFGMMGGYGYGGCWGAPGGYQSSTQLPAEQKSI
ncbi:hypothetical protein JOC37_000295 [Desulfohalotomaculum tongense]|uniref:DUF2680 domain-containing protein n=1 Tax=Desulforadius tongensis TaxID=1216062 RepID=UPI00195780C8|nr:DUF2680 domain-containing protein [Desulforadius tongensis]MBM7853930.1 hypothetical protein [Desulforadius tongensis]